MRAIVALAEARARAERRVLRWARRAVDPVDRRARMSVMLAEAILRLVKIDDELAYAERAAKRAIRKLSKKA